MYQRHGLGQGQCIKVKINVKVEVKSPCVTPYKKGAP